MRNNRVLILVLHVAHNAKCFSPCVYSYFYRLLSDNFILSQKKSTFELYGYKEGSGCRFNKNRASLRLIHNLS